MGRPRKSPTDKAETMPLDPMQTGPIPVKVMNPPAPNPWEGKYPSIDDPIEKRKYLFSYNQNPGAPIEFTKGRSVLKKNGMPGTVYESYCLEDGNEYELPVDVAKHLNSKVYYEEGKKRPRCTLVEVD